MEIQVEGHPTLGRVSDAPKKEMASVSALPDGRRLVRINSSSLSLLQECLRKSYYILKKRYVSQNESPATVFGTAIHAALEVFYSGTLSERVIPEGFDKTMDLWSMGEEPTSAEEFLVYRAARAFMEKAQPLSLYPDSNKRSPFNGMWILREYFKTYIDDPYVVLVDNKGPMVEKPCSFVLFEDDSLVVEYFGTIDVVLKHQTTGAVLVTDHKTSSVVGEQFYNRLKPNHQYTGYLLAARESLGLDTDKFLVNCVEVKAKPKTSRGKGPNFPRQVTVRTEEDFEEFASCVVFWAETLADLWDEPQERWTLGPVSSCSSYNGCQFQKVCSSPRALRENIISAEFY